MEILKSGCIFKNIVMTASRLEAFANKHFLAVYGLSVTSLKILDILSKHKSGTPTRLMKELCCTKSNITQRLNVMEKHGLIKRTSLGDTKDKRKVSIGITVLGKERLVEVVKTMGERGFEFEKKLGTKEIGECHLFLNRINDLLDQYEN